MKPTNEKTIVAVADFLKKLGMDPKLKGFEYWQTVIVFCLEDQTNLYNLTQLYSNIAKFNKISLNTIMSVLRTARDRCLDENPETYNIFKNVIRENGSVSNYNFLKYIVTCLKEELYRNR